MKTFWTAAQELNETSTTFVAVTMLSNKGHAPQDPGAKMIVTKDGLHWGTVGGGKVEARCIVEASKLLESTSGPQVYTWNLQRDIGMTCGGEVTYLFETFIAASWPIVIFGAGHVAQAVVRILLHLDCQITCIDHRKDWLDKMPSSPKLKIVHALNPEKIVTDLFSDSYFLSMTQGHAMDLPILQNLYTHFPKAPYIGGIGSAIKAKKLTKELIEFGINKDILDHNFHCPIGLPLGTNHPYEIAISVIAELLQTRDHLRDLKLKT
ncbi:MAG: XdhC family protein [Bdellovibrionales bacterium]|nr:XdhC family protein [Bdellovibrionales bacterium]